MRLRMSVAVVNHLRQEVLSLSRLWSERVASWSPTSAAVPSSMFDRVSTLENLRKALKRVQQNGDTPGSDGITPTIFAQQAERRLPQLQRCLRSGYYRPSPLRPFTMAKKGGGIRRLAVLTVQDRVAQRAVLNVLEELFEHRFSNCSFAYRPDRSVQQALRRAVRRKRRMNGVLNDADQ
jgi:CRISP-associated protein Cas1